MAEPQSTLALEAEQSPSVRQSGTEATSLRDLTPEQWKGGLAAWLGWLFDGLDMHLYTLVATPFVAQLLAKPTTDLEVPYYSSIIQAAFLLGWAIGGGFFGVIGDKIGRTRALMLTILVYAAFTGLSAIAQTWWQLMIFRFVSALGIGGEWAVGASLLSETWPRRWRPWMAAVLQTAVNIGIMLAALTTYIMAGINPRYVFLVGIAPALLVLWIRRAVPETHEWHAAASDNAERPRFANLFQGELRRTSLLVLAVCGLSLTAHWAVLYWYLQQLRNLPDVIDWTPKQKDHLASIAMGVVMFFSIVGNFLAAAAARRWGYRRTITLFCVLYFLTVAGGYGVPRSHNGLWPWLVGIGIFQGVFALFTMYLPPLFPTLLRTTGAGFCYNWGRVMAAAGTVMFGLFIKVEYRLALFYAGFLFLPAALIAWSLPELNDSAASPLHEPTE